VGVVGNIPFRLSGKNYVSSYGYDTRLTNMTVLSRTLFKVFFVISLEIDSEISLWRSENISYMI